MIFIALFEAMNLLKLISRKICKVSYLSHNSLGDVLRSAHYNNAANSFVAGGFKKGASPTSFNEFTSFRIVKEILTK